MLQAVFSAAPNATSPSADPSRLGRTAAGRAIATQTPDERAAIDAATRELGWLGQVSVGCNGPNAVLITVRGDMVEQNGTMMRQSASISWRHDRIEGMQGREHSWLELTPERRR